MKASCRLTEIIIAGARPTELHWWQVGYDEVMEQNIMRSRLLNDLAVLASDRFQERYIVNGTNEQYAIPGEILEAALNSAHKAAQPSTAPVLSPTEAIAAGEFVIFAGKASSCIDFQDATISNRQLMEQDEHWSAVRLAARRLLGAFHFDLDEWERRQGLR